MISGNSQLELDTQQQTCSSQPSQEEAKVPSKQRQEQVQEDAAMHDLLIEIGASLRRISLQFEGQRSTQQTSTPAKSYSCKT